MKVFKSNGIVLFFSNCYISNGVKQGGCISPTFFSVYLNGLIEKLRKIISGVDMAQNLWEYFVMLTI